jgi:hypothetical protein
VMISCPPAKILLPPYVKALNATQLVSATVRGYLAAFRVWNRTGWSSSGCYPEHRGTQRVRGRVGTGARLDIAVPITLPPIKYLSSDRIVT